MTTYEPVLERIRQMPGVESAALATSPPLSGMDLALELRYPRAAEGSRE